MTSSIKALCEEARQAIRISKRETSGTVAEELLDGANVIRVTLHKNGFTVTAVLKDEAQGKRKLLELILRRQSDIADIEAVYKIDE